MLVRAHPGIPAGCAQLEPMSSSAFASVLLEEAVTHVLRRTKSFVDSDDGHDSIQALLRHGDIEECVVAGEA
jgi:hypothetical protein